MLENIVYQYAKSLNYNISIGKIGNLEVDFILRSSLMDYSYVQVCRYLFNENYDENGKNIIEEREYRSLESIKDNYPKYVLSLDAITQKRNGIIHENLDDFINNKKYF